ncbi:hypothetical protein UCREL1_39 [Eutypa lata UCREL1]|uniref:Uncharacterized protein n=1 Tax=Eutypa lata (strain UCR-EL1) TaxID=1287681 RepID=M7T8B1_EUTLA|nr:hypothetical protein UCREL1_39 [Eutypa lata UCREL1]
MAPPQITGQDNTGVGAGPGPLRHPRPLTAAELHSQLEQEQELLVNRLTRDLTILRAAQNSSVVSNASSTSTSTTADQSQHPSSFTDTHLMSGPGFPIPSTTGDRRHHRTSSSASARSQNQVGGSSSSLGATSAPISIPQPHSGNAASVLEAARNPRGISMSRQNSTTSISTSHRGSRSRNHSPQPPSSYGQHGYGSSYHGGAGEHGSGYFPPRSSGPVPHHHQQQHQHQHQQYHHQQQPSSSAASTAPAATPGSELSPGLVPATLRYEETAHYRAELEAAKRDNEALKRRIKELERLVRGEQQQRRESGSVSGIGGGPLSETSTTTTGGQQGTVTSGPGRSSSESASTAASVSVGGAAGFGGGGTGIASTRRAGVERGASTTSFVSSVAVGVSDEELRVGESAASEGLRGRGEGASQVQAQTQTQAQS